jgi:hypothetical protein
MSFIDKWMKNHVGIPFTTLECAWESNVKISCKEVAYSYMWIAQYIRYCLQHKRFVATVATCLINTMSCKCPLQLGNPVASLVVKPYIFSYCIKDVQNQD